MRRTDLAAETLPALSWDPDHCANSLTTVFQHVTGQASAAITWYQVAKRPKKRGATSLRVGAIALAALAGILPMLAQIFAHDGKPLIQPVWASVALAIAAALVALDRFFGFSSGWTRYIATELRLRQILHEFQIDWETERATWRGAPPTEEQVQRVLARCKTFLTQSITIVQDETNAWINEFQTTLKQLDEAAKAKAAISELGGVNVTVSNGNQCEAGWKLSIDGGSGRSYQGTTAAAPNLVPGQHTVRVEGTIGGSPKQAEAVVIIPAGGTATIQLTLS